MRRKILSFLVKPARIAFLQQNRKLSIARSGSFQIVRGSHRAGSRVLIFFRTINSAFWRRSVMSDLVSRTRLRPPVFINPAASTESTSCPSLVRWITRRSRLRSLPIQHKWCRRRVESTFQQCVAASSDRFRTGVALQLFASRFQSRMPRSESQEKIGSWDSSMSRRC